MISSQTGLERKRKSVDNHTPGATSERKKPGPASGNVGCGVGVRKKTGTKERGIAEYGNNWPICDGWRIWEGGETSVNP